MHNAISSNCEKRVRNCVAEKQRLKDYTEQNIE